MISQRARYAIRAMLNIAPRTIPVSATVIADEEAIPKKFLEAILADLKKAGLIESLRGKNGGYRFAISAGDISFADVLRVVDGPLALAPCASRTAYRRCDDCRDVETCETRMALLRVRDATAAILESRTFALASVEEAERDPIRQ
ncbi:Rrf2 family transcriptional regulator [Fulvimarina sp. 2208YS6-2-32]|uniref:Rrf2 family transcriptional regulator n=1 Tax=Fulvimarina uroteuthidis TaxID=3098149 RepID=A0ABU5HXK2_9HYPH|nr:Rrf2 family transcriptional regulator [Fulvimarina sp. 2208YS6-2-32]MDY8107863.1 Rrf2 family transcriptional regulator [Fulvimarina sp. 2208YS6-2-32]